MNRPTRRADLLDSYAAVDWADAQIPLLQKAFISWQRRGRYKLIIEPYPDDPDWNVIAAYPIVNLDPIIQAHVGAIINSIGTALDLLMSALLTRNGIKPNSKAHFPIYKAAADFEKAVAMLESKKWVTAAEATTIKRTKAYLGGHHFLYPLHQLDILRKHERLLKAEPVISRAHTTLYGPFIEEFCRSVDNKTLLFRVVPGVSFTPSQGNMNVTAEILFNEPALLTTQQPAIGVLRNFKFSVRAIIALFDEP
jgi:hypothetical protein